MKLNINKLTLGLTTLLIFVIAFYLFYLYKLGQEKAKIERIWQQHEQVFAKLLAGKDVTMGEFDEACQFFGELTDVPIPADHSPFVDCLPTKDSGRALGDLQKWYALNHELLYWDEKSSTVKLRPR